MTRMRIGARSRAGARTLAAVGGALAVVVAVGGCAWLEQLGEDALETGDIAQFYAPPTPVPAGEPGSLVKVQELAGAPDDALAWRVMYRTTDAAGDPALATGIVVAPTSIAPAAGRPVAAWGHPTTGTAVDCAPSMWVDPFLLMEGLSPLLDRGYVVVATDYIGLGVAGPDSYLLGDPAAAAMLDAVRAAQHLDATDASDDVVLWGHSQGGHAALFAAQRAAAYAPELDVRGVAVAAPAADLGALLDAHLDDVSGVTIGSYAFVAYADVYDERMPGAGLRSILSAEGARVAPRVDALCLLTHTNEIHEIAAPAIGDFVRRDPTSVEPWATLLARNTPSRVPADLPVFVAQGLADQLVVPDDTDAYVAHLRRRGNAVTYDRMPGVNHGGAADAALPALERWLDALAVPGATTR